MIYRFGLFEFDATTSELTAEGRRVPLEPQPARALALLLSKAGEVVSRDEMRAGLWGGDTHVDFDRGLGYCIGELRSALRDRADNPRFIQTLPRRGYRFIAPAAKMGTGDISRTSPAEMSPVPISGSATPASAKPVEEAIRHSRNCDPVEISAAAPEPRTRHLWIAAALIVGTCVGAGVWVAAGRDQTPIRPNVAVAVFDNETGDPRHDRLVQGLADVVVDRLTALGPDRIGVIGNMPELRRTRSDRNLTAIARESRASFITFGQLQTRSTGLSLLIHLIRVDDGTHVWVRRINRPIGDALEGVEEEAARLVEDGVREHVLRERRAP